MTTGIPRRFGVAPYGTVHSRDTTTMVETLRTAAERIAVVMPASGAIADLVGGPVPLSGTLPIRCVRILT